MRLKSPVILLFIFAAGFLVSANISAEGMDQLRDARRYALFSPAPAYPFRARFDHMKGFGNFQLTVNYETGAVTDVKVLESTRYGVLDNRIINTFRQWRFQPHMVRTVTIPFGFMFGKKGLGNAGE